MPTPYKEPHARFLGGAIWDSHIQDIAKLQWQKSDIHGVDPYSSVPSISIHYLHNRRYKVAFSSQLGQSRIMNYRLPSMVPGILRSCLVTMVAAYISTLPMNIVREKQKSELSSRMQCQQPRSKITVLSLGKHSFPFWIIGASSVA